MKPDQTIAQLLAIADSLKSLADEIEKPEPSFQLPPCAPGHEWHRKDSWREGDLPQGWRPLLADEIVQKGDEYNSCGEFYPVTGGLAGMTPYLPEHNHYRTRRRLTFEHAGKTWTWHRPGDPMPCDGKKRVAVLFKEAGSRKDMIGEDLCWTTELREDEWIIGWRYADEKKTVPLGPEDAPPGSEFRFNSSLPGVSWTRLGVNVNGVILHTPGQEINSKKNILRTIAWSEMSDMQINRSIPLTGKWDANAWESCHKQA